MSNPGALLSSREPHNLLPFWLTAYVEAFGPDLLTLILLVLLLYLFNLEQYVERLVGLFDG